MMSTGARFSSSTNDAELNDMLKRWFVRKLTDFIVHQAFDGFEAGRLFAEKRPGFVVLDIDLPGSRRTRPLPQDKGRSGLRQAFHHSDDRARPARRGSVDPLRRRGRLFRQALGLSGAIAATIAEFSPPGRSPLAGGSKGGLAAFHARISGSVQGVGFRYYACREAMRLGLSGWVRNLPDGDVEVMARVKRQPWPISGNGWTKAHQVHGYDR